MQRCANRFAAKKEDESADNLKLLGHVYDKIHQAFLQCVRRFPWKRPIAPES